MNVLEKILGEIEDRKSYHEELLSQREDYEIQKMYCDEELNWIRDIIRSHMDNVPDNSAGWIPVSERLPETREGCLVTVRYTGFLGMHGIWVKTGHIENNGEWFGDCIGGEVIAWQPLPEPYKEE